MSKVSRRELARYAADQLLAGKPAGKIAQELVALMQNSPQQIEPEFLLGDITWELEQRQELAVGQVTSATPLSGELRALLETQIKQATGAKEVLLEEHLDSSSIGGVKIETSGRVWDGTLSKKLTELRETF